MTAIGSRATRAATCAAIARLHRGSRTLSPSDARTAIRLLGILQDNLESFIECHTLDGKLTGREPAWERREIARARRHWRTAEDLILKLEAVR